MWSKCSDEHGGRSGTLNDEKLYSELAHWWPLLSPPSDYEEEANIFKSEIIRHSTGHPKTMLELGSGGGNNASFLKRHFSITLVDISADMLRVSRRLNPECVHIQGDMRDIRLESVFDVVFIHDAISYMSTPGQLKQALATAHHHCRPGGMALFVPDQTKESFDPTTSHGGQDRGERGIRYLEWALEEQSNGEQYRSYRAYLLKENGTIKFGGVDESRLGLFSVDQWLGMIRESGFEPERRPYNHSELPAGIHSMFIGKKTMRSILEKKAK